MTDLKCIIPRGGAEMLFLCFSRMSGDVSAGDGGEPYITPFFPHERGFFCLLRGQKIRKREYIKYMKKDGKSRP